MRSNASDKDLVNMLLAEEKRTAGEYATATLEASCPTVHRTFMQLLQSALETQRRVFEFMNQNGWYSPPATAQAPDIQKQIQQSTQTQQTMQQMVGQQMGRSQQMGMGSSQMGMNRQGMGQMSGQGIRQMSQGSSGSQMGRSQQQTGSSQMGMGSNQSGTEHAMSPEVRKLMMNASQGRSQSGSRSGAQSQGKR